jgi:predicted ester cyclase
MSTENKSISRRILEESFSKGDVNFIDQVVASSYAVHDPANPPNLPTGPQAIKMIVTMYRTGFPDLRCTVDDQFTEGDRVVTRWTAVGTHRGVLGDLQPTNKRVTVTGITIDKFAQGKLVESWTNWDSAGMIQQLGVVPKEKLTFAGNGHRAQQQQQR